MKTEEARLTIKNQAGAEVSMQKSKIKSRETSKGFQLSPATD